MLSIRNNCNNVKIEIVKIKEIDSDLYYYFSLYYNNGLRLKYVEFIINSIF